MGATAAEINRNYMISAILDTNYSLFTDLQYFHIVFWGQFQSAYCRKSNIDLYLI